jgi:sulfatase maturation enzyme AslB (radical SAM superfamily)
MNDVQRPKGFSRIRSTLKHYTYPAVVIIETINKCNLNCVMCPQDKLTRPVGTMQEHLFQKIIDDVAVHSPVDTQVWLAIMGEVLLLKNRAIDFIRYAVDSGIHNVNLNTNLVVADEKLCRDLVKTGLSKIIIGMDAATEDTYNKIRVGGNFSRLLDHINHLIRAREEASSSVPELVLQFIVQEGNEHETELFRELFRDRPVSLKIRPRLGWGGNGVEAPDLAIEGNVRDYPCPWLNRTMSIHVTGQIAQCDAAWDGKHYHGDINFQTIAEAWNGRLAQIRARHWANDFDFEPCVSCNDWQCGLSDWVYCASGHK